VMVVMIAGYKLIPPPPNTNRKIIVPGSRFNRTPLPA
jgi:hypothetical protein